MLFEISQLHLLPSGALCAAPFPYGVRRQSPIDIGTASPSRLPPRSDTYHRLGLGMANVSVSGPPAKLIGIHDGGYCIAAKTSTCLRSLQESINATLQALDKIEERITIQGGATKGHRAEHRGTEAEGMNV